jgi:hypothetical protein
VTVMGSIFAPGGSITLSADDGVTYGFMQPGQMSVGGYTSATKSVWVGSQAVLDVAGTTLINPNATIDGVLQPNTGKVLPGGTIALSDDSGFVVVQAGAVLDVAGTSATLNEPQNIGGGMLAHNLPYAPQTVWSNAGAITLAAFGGLYFDGTIAAQAGAPQGQGGTLTIQPEVNSTTTTTYPGGSVSVALSATSTFVMEGPAALILQQSGNLVPAGLSPGQSFPETVTNPTKTTTLTTAGGVLEFSLDRLDGSGVSTLVIGGATNAVGNEQTLVPVAFASNVNLSLGNAVIINAPQIVALRSPQAEQVVAQAASETVARVLISTES